MGIWLANMPDVYRPSEVVQKRTSIETGVRFSGEPSRGMRLGASEDSALAVHVNLSAAARSLREGATNGRRGVAFADAAVDVISTLEDKLDQMTDLATRAGRGVANLDTEFQAIKTEITRVANEAEYGDRVLLNGSFSINLEISGGGTTSQPLTFSIASATAASLGLGSTSVTNMATAGVAATNLSDATDTLGGIRDNVEAARSQIAGALDLADSFRTVTQGNLFRYRAGRIAEFTETSSEDMLATAVADLVGPTGRGQLSRLDAKRLTEIHGDVVTLRESVETFKRALGTGSVADASDHNAEALSDANLNLVAKQTSQPHLRADADKMLGEVSQWKGLKSGAFLVNSTPISVDVEQDSLREVLTRINESDADVTARLIGRDQRLQITANDAISGLSLDSNSTEFFKIVHVVEGSRNARTTDVQAKRAAAVLGDMGEALNRLYRDIEGAGVLDVADRLRASVKTAFLNAAGSVNTTFHTKLGFSLDFSEGASAAFTYASDGQATFRSLLEKEPVTVRDFFLGTSGNHGSGLLDVLISRLADAEEEIGSLIDLKDHLVNLVA